LPVNLVVAAAAETNRRLLGALQFFYKIFSVLGSTLHFTRTRTGMSHIGYSPGICTINGTMGVPFMVHFL
jgi:hypothetical protein